MCFSGFDPNGEAGIRADIETLFGFGCHTLPIPTMIAKPGTKGVLYAGVYNNIKSLNKLFQSQERIQSK